MVAASLALGCLCLPDDLAAQSRTMVVGYGSGNLETDLPRGENNYSIYMDGAMQLPSSYMEQLVGSKLTRIRVALADTLTDQENAVFLSYDLAGKPFYTQPVERFEAGWNEVVLDVPYEITEARELYVGFSYRSKGYVVSFDGEESNGLGDWFAFSQLDVENPSWHHETGSGSLNLQAVVEGDNLPQDALSVVSARIAKCVPAGERVPVDIVVRNMGANVVESVSLDCTMKDGTQSFELTGLDIPSNGLRLLSLDDFVVGYEGISDFSVEVAAVNGQPNTHEEEAYVAENLLCRAEYANRMILMEQFSTANCSNCPTAHSTLLRAMEKQSNMIWVTHHSAFGTDDYSIPASQDYLYFFGSEAPYAPAMMLDRTNFYRYGADIASGPAFEVGTEIVPKLLEEENNTPAYVTVGISSTYDADSRRLEVEVSGGIPSKDLSKLSGDDIRLNVYLVEDSLRGMQIGLFDRVYEDYHHDNVLRQVLTDVWGDAVAFDAEGNYASAPYAFTLPEGWQPENMRIVAFLANTDLEVPNNCVVQNAAQVRLGESSLEDVSIDEASALPGQPRIHRWGDVLEVEGCEGQAGVYAVSGSLVKVFSLGSGIDISGLAPGIYILRLSNEEGNYTFKFIK